MLDAKVFVTTYSKYNQGSRAGFWVPVADYDSKDDFIDACLRLHSDEVDPELFFVDSDGLDAGICSESYISPALWDDLLPMNDEELLLYRAYIEAVGVYNGMTPGEVLDEAKEAYIGTYDSEADFADEIISNAVDNGEISQNFSAYIDSDRYWDAELRHNYFFSNGFIFQNI